MHTEFVEVDGEPAHVDEVPMCDGTTVVALTMARTRGGGVRTYTVYARAFQSAHDADLDYERVRQHAGEYHIPD